MPQFSVIAGPQGERGQDGARGENGNEDCNLDAFNLISTRFWGMEEDIEGDVSRNLSEFKQWELPPN